MSFYDWLQKHFNKSDCPIGDLAMDAKNDKGFPRDSRKRKDLLLHLHIRHACYGCIEAFEDAFKRYRKSGCNRP